MRMSRLAAGILFLMLAGCSLVPQAGPSSQEILGNAAMVTAAYQAERPYLYHIVVVDDRIAKLSAALRDERLRPIFGSGGRPPVAAIGVGDELTVTIFEASTSGLFSTTENKSTTVRIVVQPDGHASIPYVGNIRLSGRTLEAARQAILSSLRGKAVEPDVLINISQNASRTVSVSGEVNAPREVPLSLTGERVLEVIAKAGGPKGHPYDTVVSLTRGGEHVSARLADLIRIPSENIFVAPGDQIFLTHDPSRFVVLGSSGKKGRIPFEAPEVNLLEAIALAGGQMEDTADPQGVFVFRHEAERVLRQIYGEREFSERLAAGIWPSALGSYPIVYHIDLSRPESYLFAQNFQMQSGDVLYLALHPATEITKFLQLLGLGLATAAAAAAL